MNCDRCGVESAELAEGLCVACWDQRVEAEPVVALSVCGKPLSMGRKAINWREWYGRNREKYLGRKRRATRDRNDAERERDNAKQREYYRRNRLKIYARRKHLRLWRAALDTRAPKPQKD